MTRQIEVLTARARAARSQAAVRRWELRQLGHAAGAWHRLARLLTLTRRAWVISDEDAERLLAAGHHPEAAGLAFEPSRRFFLIREQQVASLSDAQEIALQASPELLGYRNLALVQFDEATEPIAIGP